MGKQDRTFRSKAISGIARGRGPRRRRKRPSRRPSPMTVEQILGWADEHRARTGKWPNVDSGRARGEPYLHWKTIDTHLRKGCRGLPGGSSLLQMLHQYRGVPLKRAYTPLSIEQVLAWADAHRKRTGKWPIPSAGKIHGETLESWNAVNQALKVGCRGLPGGTTLGGLLAEHRGIRFRGSLPKLRKRQILAWADAHRKRTGAWPNGTSGSVEGSGGETWLGIEGALRRGRRGLPAGGSIARLLAERRRVPNRRALPKLSVRQVLAWADAHKAKTGRWPNQLSGRVECKGALTWTAVNAALVCGYRGLRGGSSLARLLIERRGARSWIGLPPLSIKQILAWAGAYHKRTGCWPIARSGPIRGSSGETWCGVDAALRAGCRGLRGGSSLARLLAKHRRVRNLCALPPLTIEQILEWADKHRKRTGQWPCSSSGPVMGAPGETWSAVNNALNHGCRGLPSGEVSLTKLLARYRGVRNRNQPPRLTVTQILEWADLHHRRTGRWPHFRSGAVEDAPGETWRAVNSALYHGYRGLPGSSSLAKLLNKHHR